LLQPELDAIAQEVLRIARSSGDAGQNKSLVDKHRAVQVMLKNCVNEHLKMTEAVMPPGPITSTALEVVSTLNLNVAPLLKGDVPSYAESTLSANGLASPPPRTVLPATLQKPMFKSASSEQGLGTTSLLMVSSSQSSLPVRPTSGFEFNCIVCFL
jgi:hypothetical protein